MKQPPLRRLLIVEDDPMVRKLLTRHFEKGGAVIHEAADAEQAFEIFRLTDTLFDVVVTDVHLPGMDGLELATRLRGLRPTQPIVFVTGDVDEKLARRALASGKAGYLLKPFEFFELDAAVAQALERGTTTDPAPAGPTRSEADWLAEQRMLLLAASQRAVDVGRFTPARLKRAPVAIWIKMTITIVALLGIALMIGWWLSGEPEPSQTTPAEQPQEGRTIYVPYEAPEQPRRETDRRR